MWLSPRFSASTTDGTTSTRSTCFPASAKTCASGTPTYPAPTMATSHFIGGLAYSRGPLQGLGPSLRGVAVAVQGRALVGHARLGRRGRDPAGIVVDEHVRAGVDG